MNNEAVNMTIFDYLDYDIKSFKDNPPTKIGNIKVNSAFSKKYIYPIFEQVQSMSSHLDIQTYFENTFYFGKRKGVPYADFWKFLIGERGCRTMLMTDSFSDFIFILNHHGRQYGGHVPIDDLVYPPNMTADDYRNSLSENEIRAILKDCERLCRLHSNRSSMLDFVNTRLEDYGIDYFIGGVDE